MAKTTAHRASTSAAAIALPTDWNESTPVTEKLKWLHATYKTPPQEHIGKLPKPTRKDNTKGECSECGGFHGLPAVHLDYLGHAELTDILLFVDPLWTWAPFAVDKDTGLPKVVTSDRGSALWITLTIWGVSRPGVGTSEPKGPDTFKELIGDALRNAAMRFGIAVDLWSKAEGIERKIDAGQHVDADSDHDPNRQPPPEDREPKPNRRSNTNAKRPEPDVWTYDGLVALGLRTLNEMSRNRSLPCSGKVEDYAMRLMDWRAKNATPTQATSDVPADHTDEDEPAAETPTEPPPGSQHPDDGTDAGEPPADDRPIVDDMPDDLEGEWDDMPADPASVKSILDDVRALKTAKARAYATFRRTKGIPTKPEEWTNGHLDAVAEFLDRLDAPVAS